MYVYIYIYIYCAHWLPDVVRTNGAFAEGAQVHYGWKCFVLSAHILAQIPYVFRMLPHFCHESCLLEIAALL